MNESPACDVRNGGGENVEREQENEEKFVKSGLMCGWVGEIDEMYIRRR